MVAILNAERAKEERAILLARERFAPFIRLAWHVLNPGRPLIWNWHVDCFAEHLEAVTAGQIKRLIFSIPPGSMKTTAVSIDWPCWEWIAKPELRYLCASYADVVSHKINRDRRAVLQSEWYRRAFGPTWELEGDAQAVGFFGNTRRGWMRAISTHGAALSFHGDRLLVDDANNADDVYTVELQNTPRWFRNTLEGRADDIANTPIVNVAQRLAAKDLTGELLKEQGWEHVCLPAEFDRKRRCVTSIGWKDPRTRDGELLFPQRFPQEALDRIKREPSMGARRFRTQYQQDPPEEDEMAIFRRDAWRFWAHNSITPGAEKLQEEFDAIVGSWDGAVDGGKKNDYYAGHVWARKGSRYYLLDRMHFQARFTEAKKKVKRFAEKWPEVLTWLFEKAALGPAIVDSLKSDDADEGEAIAGVSGMQLVRATEPKVQRAEAISGLVDAGDVYLPHITVAPWIGELIEEAAAFPGGDHDDDVDAMSQALRWLSSRVKREGLPAMPKRQPTAPDLPGAAAEREKVRAGRDAHRLAVRAIRAARRTGRPPNL